MSCEESRQGFAFNNPDIDSDYLAPAFGRIVHPDELRYDELFGNQLIAEADSQSITDDQLSDYERLAIRYFEVELNIDILPRRIRYENLIDESGDEITRTDYDDTAYIATFNNNRKQETALYLRETGYPYRVIAARHESFVKLRRRPVRNVLTANFVDPYFGNTIIDLMPYRIIKKGFSGTCFFRPRQLRGSINSYQYIWNRYIFGPFYRDLQNMYLIDYESGYENCQDVPDEFRNIIKKTAALTLLNIYGDGKLAAIAARSVNLNSVSESISTTLSATSATFGARIIQYRKEVQEWYKQNRAKYSRTLFGNLG
jgi:hypothetical protein